MWSETSAKKSLGDVAEFAGSVAGLIHPAIPFGVKALRTTADYVLDRRAESQPLREWAPGYLITQAKSDADLHAAFKRFTVSSISSANVNGFLQTVEPDSRRQLVKRLWQIVLDDWGSGSEENFLITAVLTGSGPSLAELPAEANQVQLLCRSYLKHEDYSRARFIESMCFALPWAGFEDLHSTRQIVQLSVPAWARRDWEDAVKLHGDSRIGAFNEIVEHLTDPEAAASFRRHDLSRYIQYLASAPEEEQKSEQTIRFLAKLFRRCRSDDRAIKAGYQALQRATKR